MRWKAPGNALHSHTSRRAESLLPEPDIPERSADIYWPKFSPVALNIVTYRFGTSAEATRPDHVMRFPTAALLIQRRGGLYEHVSVSQRVAMPRFALLGPTCTGHIWETEPNTLFSLVNLAPGAAQALLGIDPRDVGEQVEPLNEHALSDEFCQLSEDCPEILHQNLCRIFQSRGDHIWRLRHAHKLVMSINCLEYGPRVQEYADHFGMTPRTLQRVVSEAVGLTPKQMLVIQRVRKLVRLTTPGWSHSFAELAQESGFYDQSHMRYDLQRLGMETVGQLVEGGHIGTGR